MSLRTSFLGVLGALLMIPAAAQAADRETTLSSEVPEYTWTSADKTGFVYTSDVANRVPACSAAFACDSTLVQTDEYGNLQIDIVGKGVQGQATLNDVDVHVYVSNANGAKGELLGEDTSPDTTEFVLLEDLPAGFYLVYTDWYFGAGSIDGKVRLSEPTTPADPDNPPVFTPAEDVLTPVTPARSVELAAPGGEPSTWQAQGTGFADLVSSGAPCTAATCDWTLMKANEAGLLTLTTTGSETLVDGDIALYRSNAEAGLGESLGAATAFTPNETLAVEVEPGFYLMRYTFTGAGTYTAKASLSEIPVFEE